MLTIRRIGLRGEEVVFQAAEVIKGSDAQHTNDQSWMIEFYGIDHLQVTPPAFFGQVFVMNENGKTVATYDLGSTPGRKDGEV